METLKYKIITTKKQYFDYCNTLETLVFSNNKPKAIEEEIDLLTLLIEDYDAKHSKFIELEPIELLKSFMKENKLKNKDLAEILSIGEPAVSDILNLRRGLSKETIRLLSNHFKVNQEAFNKPYKLKSDFNSHLRNASVMNTEKVMAFSRV